MVKAETPAVPAAASDDPRWELVRRGDAKARAQLIEDHLPLLSQVVGVVCRKLPAHVEREEIQSFGVFGLIQAVDTFDPSRASFRTHAVFLIKNRIYDELRSLDWAPRSVRKKIKDVETLRASLQSGGMQGTDREVAEAMGVEVGYVRTVVQEVATTYPSSLTDFDYAGEIGEQRLPVSLSNLEQQSQVSECLDAFAAWVDTLGQQEQRVWALRFYCGYTVQETATLLGVSTPVVAKASQRLFASFGKFMDSLTGSVGAA